MEAREADALAENMSVMSEEELVKCFGHEVDETRN